MKGSIEQKLHWAVWSGGVLYSLWNFCQSAYKNYALLDPADFKRGWTILQRNQDVSDTEWIVLTNAFKKHWIWIIGQVLLTQTIFCRSPKLLPFFYAVYSVGCLLLIVGPKATVIYLSYILIIFVVHLTGRKQFCYILTTVALYILHEPFFIKAKESIVVGYMEGFLVDVGLAWLIARCLSFSVDRIEQHNHKHITARDCALILGYCLYLPAVFTGPILNYSLFVEQMSQVHCKWTLKNFVVTASYFLRLLILYFVLEILLHFIYSSSVQYYPELVERFSAWSLCGLGYALPTLFYVKYLVIYGLAGCIAQLEQFEFPPPPKCISRVHLSSYLWRHFDRGLYLWILRYLYFPLINKNFTVARKIFALLFCFIFASIWHGMDKAVCTWSILNVFLVASEVIASYVSSTKSFRKIDKSLSSSNQKRLRALCATPHFMLMCISCTFFLSNWDVGVLFYYKIICGGLIPVLPTAFIMYCGCHVSMDVKEWEEKYSKLTKVQPGLLKN